MQFQLQTTGIFAVLFFPRSRTGPYYTCGFICHNKKIIIITVFMIIPLIIILLLSLLSFLKESQDLVDKNLEGNSD